MQTDFEIYRPPYFYLLQNPDFATEICSFFKVRDVSVEIYRTEYRLINT